MRSEKAGLSNLAVARATGKTWDQWLDILDGAGAKRLSHKETAQWVSANFPVGGWWAQMVTVGYERMRGLRNLHERVDGSYTANISRTVAAPQSAVWPALRNLGKGFTIKSATEGKVIRFAGKGSVEIRLAAKGEGKSQISVEHSKLKSEEEVTAMRQHWTTRLSRLKQDLEKVAASRN